MSSFAFSGEKLYSLNDVFSPMPVYVVVESERRGEEGSSPYVPFKLDQLLTVRSYTVTETPFTFLVTTHRMEKSRWKGNSNIVTFWREHQEDSYVQLFQIPNVEGTSIFTPPKLIAIDGRTYIYTKENMDGNGGYYQDHLFSLRYNSNLINRVKNTDNINLLVKEKCGSVDNLYISTSYTDTGIFFEARPERDGYDYPEGYKCSHKERLILTENNDGTFSISSK